MDLRAVQRVSSVQLATSTKLTKHVNAIHLVLLIGYISGETGRRSQAADEGLCIAPKKSKAPYEK